MFRLFKRKKVRVLFICLANICRSPMAEALFRHKVEEARLQKKINIGSASIANWRNGDDAHRGTVKVLEAHGISSQGLVSELLTERDIEEADYVICMDQQVLTDARMRAGEQNENKVFLFNSFLGRDDDVLDPMITKDFDTAYENIDEGTSAILAYIKEKENL